VTSPSYGTFTEWEGVLAFVREHGVCYYQAPMSYVPACVPAKVVGDVVRVTPDPEEWRVPGTNRIKHLKQDPFDADVGHLDRFRKRAGT